MVEPQNLSNITHLTNNGFTFENEEDYKQLLLKPGNRKVKMIKV
jgi:hypothetical protein